MSLSQQLFLRQQLSDGTLPEIGASTLFGINNHSILDASIYQAAPSEFMVRYKFWYASYHGEQLRVPRFNKSDLDLEHLWDAVKCRGGSAQVCGNKQWAEIGRMFDPPASMTNLSFHIKRIYEKYLLAYEKTISPQTAMDWRHAPTNQLLLQQQHSFAASSIPEDILNVPTASPSPRSPPHKKQAHGPNVQSTSNQSNSNLNINLNFNLSQIENLVGSVIKLFVADQGDYQNAIVTGFDSQMLVHTIRLQDGSVRDVKLADCNWRIVQHSGKDGMLQNVNNVNSNLSNNNSANSNSHTDTPIGNQVRQFLLSNSVSFDTAPAEFSQPRVVHFDKEDHKGGASDGKLVSNENKLNVVSGRNTPPEEKSQSMASSFAPLVYKLQTQLQTALGKIQQLEVREEQRVQEMQQMQSAFIHKERQLRLLIDEMRLQLREAQEGKQTAEGAVQELRNCFSLLVNTQGLPPSLFP
eukprot:TRINITY_DN18271_c1_g1_i2.p1 TRINITY_DN18271_c1_g1~~TRINITY_DN18271_c1_g1_i2.p1  ORF type:complete len:467 (+),score=85.87 TRINITY_DN18271_c1_g1_i2:221-1621(+)